MSIFEKLETKNNRKSDLILAGAYFVLTLVVLAAAIGILLIEPGNALGDMVENILYVTKIAIVASMGLYALYCLIKSISSVLYIIRRK